MSTTVAPPLGRDYDVVALGEVMLRLDPGPARIRRACAFEVWEGGGEYNAIRALSGVFGLRTALLSALADDDVGQLLASLVRANGVDLDHVRWRERDGTGSNVRNGLNFVERGFGVRGPKGVSDRANSAASQLRPGDLDLSVLDRTRWLHTGGVFAGIGDQTVDVAVQAARRAHRSGAVVSVDVNFRPSLWPDPAAAAGPLRLLCDQADVLIAGPRDLGLVLGVDATAEEPLSLATCRRLAFEQLPQLKVLASTHRVERSAIRHDWTASLATADGWHRRLPGFHDLAVYDRIGGGDAFAAGLIWGLLHDVPLERAGSIGLALGALTMTTPGDGAQATLAEVMALADGEGGRTQR